MLRPGHFHALVVFFAAGSGSVGGWTLSWSLFMDQCVREFGISDAVSACMYPSMTAPRTVLFAVVGFVLGGALAAAFAHWRGRSG